MNDTVARGEDGAKSVKDSNELLNLSDPMPGFLLRDIHLHTFRLSVATKATLLLMVVFVRH